MIHDAMVILRKELKNLIKDRRTLVLLLVLPLVIMPLVFGTIGTVTASQQKQAAQTVYTVWIRGNDDPAFADILRREISYDPATRAGGLTLVVGRQQIRTRGKPGGFLVRRADGQFGTGDAEVLVQHFPQRPPPMRRLPRWHDSLQPCSTTAGE